MQTTHRSSVPTLYVGNKEEYKSQMPRSVYTVQDGDTIAGIALKHGMRESDLRKLNHLFGGYIFKGQELVVRIKVRSLSVPLNSVEIPASVPQLARRQSQMKQIEKIAEQSSSKAEPTSANNQIDEPSIENPLPLSLTHNINVKKNQPETEPTSKKQLVDVTSIPKLRNATAMDILPDPRISKFLIPKLEACLPPQYRGYDWSLVYSLAQHGASLDTLYRNTRNKRTSLIIIETGDGDIFGAFVASPWSISKSFYGTGECFVFTCYPKFEHFGWKGENLMIMFSNESMLAMGGGGGFAWGLNGDLSRGTSARSLTFENRCLTRRSEYDVVNCEVWEFVPKN